MYEELFKQLNAAVSTETERNRKTRNQTRSKTAQVSQVVESLSTLRQHDTDNPKIKAQDLSLKWHYSQKMISYFFNIYEVYKYLNKRTKFQP